MINSFEIGYLKSNTAKWDEGLHLNKGRDRL